MTDLANFNPGSVDSLFGAILQEGERALGRPIENVQAVAAHLRMLAEESLKTAKALAEGRIDAETAREVFEGRQAVLVQMGEFVELTGLQAMQRVADAVFRVIGFAILNRTGINIAPGLLGKGG